MSAQREGSPVSATGRQDEGPRNRALLEFDAVSKRFEKRLDVIERFARRLGASVSEHTVHAVDQVTFAVDEREVVGTAPLGQSRVAEQLIFQALPRSRR